LGCSCIDFLGIVPRLPRLDEEIELLDSTLQGGGEVATALVTLAKLGVSAAYIGKVSDDPIGVMIKNDFEGHGVNTDYVIVEPGERSLTAIVLVDKNSGKRSILAGKATVSEVLPAELPNGVIEQAEVLHLDGTEPEASVIAAKRARAAGVTVVLDADVLALGPRIGRVIGLTDIVIASQPFASEYSGCDDPKAAVDQLRQAGPKTAIVTLGDAGGAGKIEDRAFRYTAFGVDVVDTTGAGDVFHGAFIRGLVADWPLEKTVKFAAAVAAIKCTKPGGRSGIPDMATAEHFLTERGDAFEFEYLTS
jgi:sugar/nucleoside kinase (ribokinase family)